MPSPFPGMDPYLEEAAGWQNFHNRLITYLGDALNACLPPGYVALATERVTVEYPGEVRRGIAPDVSVIRHGRGSAHAAVAEFDPPLLVGVEPVDVIEAGLEIRDRRGKRLVTAIEVVSPTNKSEAGGGRDSYLKKQREIVASPAHLVEIDLLRQGRWTLAVPEIVARQASVFEYLVSVSRAYDRGHFEIYPIRHQDRLPRIAVPLAEEDPDVVANLQTLFEGCYERGRFSDLIDYSRDPSVPLAREHGGWLEQVLRQAGLRG